MLAIKISLCIIVTFSLLISAENYMTVSQKQENEWDVLIFTQHWPATVCSDWKKKGHGHSCALPSQKDAWTIHGIWPTKLGTIGPGFCNTSWHFNSSQLQPIEAELEQFWINIEKDTPLYSLWKHEWTKHGTCAAQLELLRGESKYFGQGLRWLQQYSMSDILLKAGFSPDSSQFYNAQDMYTSIKKRIGKNPAMYCQIDAHSGISYIFEIRICFDKNLKLIDCDGIKIEGERDSGDLLHCDLSRPVVYTDIISNIQLSQPSWEWPIIEIYKLITWLQWFTL